MALASANPAWAQQKGDDVLAAKNLRLSGSMLAIQSEDEVKKAAETAQARLKEYRIAAYREKDLNRSAAEKESLIKALTKQRNAVQQQFDRVRPALRAQMQELRQQQAALREQIGPMRDAAIYTSNNFARVQNNQLVDVHNGIGDQIEALVMQSNQYVDTLNELGYRIDMLRDGPDADSSGNSLVSAADKREAYADALKEQRKLVEETRKAYADLAADAEVKSALAALNKRSPKTKYTLGPSKKFQDLAKAMEKAEQQLASGAIDSAKPETAAKRKARPGKRK
jgi:hypothetical protein